MSQPYGGASKSELQGIGGWLIFVAIGQVLGPIQLALSLMMYQMSVPDGVWGAFPVAMLVELLITLALLGVAIWTSILFFTKRASFLSMFTVEWIAATVYFPLIIFWSAGSTGLPVSNFVTGEDWFRWLVLAAIGFLWVIYVHKSVRVRNTFIE